MSYRKEGSSTARAQPLHESTMLGGRAWWEGVGRIRPPFTGTSTAHEYSISGLLNKHKPSNWLNAHSVFAATKPFLFHFGVFAFT